MSGAIAVGLYARVLLPELAAVPAAQKVLASEQALPRLAIALLPDVMIGLTLAGLFAATMSTADSQILSCSAALTEDVAPRWRESYIASKVGMLSVAALALAIALTAGEGVFALLPGFAAAFAVYGVSAAGEFAMAKLTKRAPCR